MPEHIKTSRSGDGGSYWQMSAGVTNRQECEHPQMSGEVMGNRLEEGRTEKRLR